jgi:hypothetical protein
MAEGKFAEACPKLEESQRLDPTSGMLINLASCYEQEGLIASAWTTFMDAAAAASRAGNAEREKTARDRATALAPRLSKIIISVAGSDKINDIDVKRDGTTLGKAQWGVAIPADPGLHKVTVTAPGRKSWQNDVMLKGGRDIVTVQVPDLEPIEQTLPPSPPRTEPTGNSGELARIGPEQGHAGAEQADTGGLGGQKIAALAVGGAGVGGLAIGAIFALQLKSKESDRDNVCPGYVHCTQPQADQIQGLTDDAKSSGRLATVGFVVGATALVGGVVLFVTAPSTASKKANAIDVRPWVGPSTAGAAVGGRW